MNLLDLNLMQWLALLGMGLVIMKFIPSKRRPSILDREPIEWSHVCRTGSDDERKN